MKDDLAIMDFGADARSEVSAAAVPQAAAVPAVPLFADFYGVQRPRVVRALSLTLGDTDLAVEAADEAMVRAYQRWSKISRYDNPGGWVYRVGLNWARSARRRRRLDLPAPATDLGASGAEEPAPGEPPEPTVAAALLALDVEQRAVIVCRFYLGLSEAETAATLGIRPGTAKSRLHRGLLTLSSRLHHLHPEEF